MKLVEIIKQVRWWHCWVLQWLVWLCWVSVKLCCFLSSLLYTLSCHECHWLLFLIKPLISISDWTRCISCPLSYGKMLVIITADQWGVMYLKHLTSLLLIIIGWDHRTSQMVALLDSAVVVLVVLGFSSLPSSSLRHPVIHFVMWWLSVACFTVFDVQICQEVSPGHPASWISQNYPWHSIN